MKNSKKMISALIASLLAFSSLAMADDVSDFANKLHSKYPTTNSISGDQIQKVNGLYTFQLAGQRVYSDPSVTYMLVGGELLGSNGNGGIINLTPKTFVSTPASQQNSVDLTTQSYLSKIIPLPFKQTLLDSDLTVSNPNNVWSAFPWSRTINYVFGKGERHIIVVEDPDCPFCANLEKNLESIGSRLNMTVSILPVGLSIHTKEVSAGQADSIKHNSMLACNGDYAVNWRDWMMYSANHLTDNAGNLIAPESNWKNWTSGKLWNSTESGTCPKSEEFAKNLASIRQINLTATPTIIFPNGAIQVGVPSDLHSLEAFFDQAFNWLENQGKNMKLSPVKVNGVK